MNKDDLVGSKMHSPSKKTPQSGADLWPWNDQLVQMCVCVSALTSYVKLCVVVDGRLTCQFSQTLLGTVVHHQAEGTVLYQQLHRVEKPVIHRLHAVTRIWQQAFSVVYDRLSLNSTPDRGIKDSKTQSEKAWHKTGSSTQLLLHRVEFGHWPKWVKKQKKKTKQKTLC